MTTSVIWPMTLSGLRKKPSVQPVSHKFTKLKTEELEKSWLSRSSTHICASRPKLTCLWSVVWPKWQTISASTTIIRALTSTNFWTISKKAWYKSLISKLRSSIRKKQSTISDTLEIAVTCIFQESMFWRAQKERFWWNTLKVSKSMTLMG